MESINVNGLPEEWAKALQAMVNTIRQQLKSGKCTVESEACVRIPKWRGRVTGSLSREDLYGDNF